MQIKQLLDLPRECICGFINEDKKMAYVVLSNNTLRTISYHVAMLKDKTHQNQSLVEDRENLDFVIFEDTVSKEAIINNIKITEVEDLLIANGYTLYKESSSIGIDARHVIKRSDGMYKVFVTLNSRGRPPIYIKEFTTKKDATDYIQSTSILAMAEEFELTGGVVV